MSRLVGLLLALTLAACVTTQGKIVCEYLPNGDFHCRAEGDVSRVPIPPEPGV